MLPVANMLNLTARMAAVYGEVLKKDEIAINVEATRAKRALIREARLALRKEPLRLIIPGDIKRKIMKFADTVFIFQ